MKKITYIKSFSFLIAFLSVVSFGFGQTMLAQFNFETPGGYSTSIPEFTDFVNPGTGTDGRDYFIRTDGTNTRAETYTNKQGSYYFAAQDIDGEGATLPVYLLINNINISGYSNLEFRVHLAEDDAADGNENWDNTSANNDYLHINHDIDNSGIFNNLLWIESNNTGLSNEPAIDTNFDGTGDGTVITNAFAQFTQNIIGTGDLLDIQIVFRLDAEEEDIAIDNIEIWGTLVPCASTVTWNGSLPWVGGTPDLTTIVELNADYETATYGSFSACSLNVNSSTLTINDNNYIEVQNDITTSTGSSINIQPKGAIIQNNDFSSVTNNGTMTVSKETAPADFWYEYTYWSSPVLGETIGQGLFESEATRRYIFKGQNFLDATAESNNDNTQVPGQQDDIDDNGDDWGNVSSSTVMQAGVGYAAMHDETVFNFTPGFPKQIIYNFEGDFNNGVVSVPVYRNDSELNDNNWNFIGNPYPSAINADAFLAANANVDVDAGITTSSGTVDGAIFLWSQNTLPSATANGNQNQNFSDADYAIINGSGQTSGGDDVLPNRFIPSGQGFFIPMANSAPATSLSGDIYTSNVTFSNSMRVVGTTDNSQFFKNSNTKNTTSVDDKLWLNLTSDNGVFNQILIGYINGATNNDDGSYYDAKKMASPNIFASFYSIIENSDKKYAIQGKAPNSLNEDEIISLGFSTHIDVATLYTLSIAQIQGDFLTNNPIYLKDNVLNTTHDLSVSDYTFTSEVGEFNSRFQIVFSANALSTENAVLDLKTLRIVDLSNNRVQFNVSGNLNIKTVTIFDLLGRQLYNLKGNSPSETYNLSNLNDAIYIAKVELSNGAIITKKAVKR
tara:strand:- start:154 stop:2682 length:2529 start_codon:yes stop_codon:yes gene_type:complete